MLTVDEETNKCRLPTRENIFMAMDWLVQDCSSGDSLVFQFSGMGAQVSDMDGDERDGLDEALCPMDYFNQGPILDDEINEAIVRPLVPGVKLHAIVDAWHSTTVLDLPYQCVMSKSVINLDPTNLHLRARVHNKPILWFFDQEYRVPEVEGRAPSDRRVQRHQGRQGRAHQWQQQRQQNAY
jgi:hypothetical protein